MVSKYFQEWSLSTPGYVLKISKQQKTRQFRNDNVRHNPRKHLIINQKDEGYSRETEKNKTRRNIKMEIAKLINNKPNHKVGDEDEGNEGK